MPTQTMLFVRRNGQVFFTHLCNTVVAIVEFHIFALHEWKHIKKQPRLQRFHACWVGKK